MSNISLAVIYIIYVIIAILFEVIMVVGLPVILLSEPYVNHWINFSRIKPILDQFQGCYRDKCRWFAGVYLLSRQAILIIMVISFVHYYIALYLLTLLCIIIALLYHHVQPYKVVLSTNLMDLFFICWCW